MNVPSWQMFLPILYAGYVLVTTLLSLLLVLLVHCVYIYQQCADAVLSNKTRRTIAYPLFILGARLYFGNSIKST